MRKIRKKLTNQRGETLVELLAAILIAALSVGLLLGSVAASSAMNRKARENSQQFYEKLSAAENRQTSAGTGVIKIHEGTTEIPISIQLYGGDGLYSYGIQEEP